MDELRAADLRYLERFYQSDDSCIVTVYGNKNIDSNELLLKFLENRKFFYYDARSASDKLQQKLMEQELKAKGLLVPDNARYEKMIELIGSIETEKPFIIVLQNFENIVRMSGNFWDILCNYVYGKKHSNKIMVLAVSDKVSWVENSMVDTLGDGVVKISGFLKIKGLGFKSLRRKFSEMSYTDAVITYSILGRYTRLWNYFDESLSMKENICKNILDPFSALYQEAKNIITDNLRETSVYNTILCELSQGNDKLNDIHLSTGFPRAKIAVYLKNLMELEIVSKAYSFSSADRENTRKGVYRISDPLVKFFFKFLYPNESSLRMMPADKFYDIFISAGLSAYAADCFKGVCMEYIDYLVDSGRFPFEIEQHGEWVGKLGNIDIIAQSEVGDTLIGQCMFREEFGYDDYEWLLTCTSKAKLSADYFYLFSTSGFDQNLIKESELSGKIRLIDLDELSYE
ncbi:MAG: DUF234 domain-containing protein [Butyrivibrio sp.]|nr:DUF234 domain-containing protein [Butyrivibrio sp.]